MTFRYRLAVAVHFLAVVATALGATWAASFLPITDPVTAEGLCIVAGSIGTVAALAWLPEPTRKDGR